MTTADKAREIRELAEEIGSHFYNNGFVSYVDPKGIALLEAARLDARIDENAIADTRITSGQDLVMHRQRKAWLESEREKVRK